MTQGSPQPFRSSRHARRRWGDLGAPWVIAEHEEADLCEPGLIQSPDGSRLALLLRENSRAHESFIVFSDDEGETWSEPREVPRALTGDRHTGRYAPDGRLVITYRDMAQDSPTKGDWVAWIGQWEDLAQGRPGGFRVRFMDNTDPWDAAYPVSSSWMTKPSSQRRTVTGRTARSPTWSASVSEWTNSMIDCPRLTRWRT